MTSRAEQRAETRRSITDAAVRVFAANGFDGASTRDIAACADVSQGLVTYHFPSKADLWRAAATALVGEIRAELPIEELDSEGLDNETVREAIRAFVRLNGRRPELFHFIVDAGRHDDDRMRWLVETHLRHLYPVVSQLADDAADAPHLFYALVGSGSLIFATAPEVRELTGLDATDRATIERHADFLARLFVPDP